MAGVPLPLERIHSTTVSGEPKAGVLARLAAEHPEASGYFFVEDKLGTLEKVRPNFTKKGDKQRQCICRSC